MGRNVSRRFSVSACDVALMVFQALLLVFGLAMVLVAAEFFTNGIEALGRHYSFSQAVVGSILAAVGTAMPETILPVVAIFLYGGESARDIGVGAILGAPFMLSTLAFSLVGITVLVASLSNRRRFEVSAEAGAITRDLSFFLVLYSLSIVLPSLLGRAFSVPMVVTLLAGYLLYAYRTFRAESADLEHSEEMYLWRLWKRMRHATSGQSAPLIWIVVQVLVGLAVMIKGAHLFVASLGYISIRFGMSPLLFSLLVAPFATELPEKFNSVTWTWKGRDTLAMGNISGAMVFQATFPVSVGLLFTNWEIHGLALLSAVLALLSSLVLLAALRVKKRVPPTVLIFSGCLYLVYVFVVVLGK